VKIVAICGSPHKGSCYSVLKAIADNHPEVDYKLIMLGELTLGSAKGAMPASRAARTSTRSRTTGTWW
jgi:hypothetical protein